MEDLDGPIVDWNQYQIAMEAFGVCDLDGTEGLTWQEIEACEVIHTCFLKFCLRIFLLLIIKNFMNWRFSANLLAWSLVS